MHCALLVTYFRDISTWSTKCALLKNPFHTYEFHLLLVRHLEDLLGCSIQDFSDGTAMAVGKIEDCVEQLEEVTIFLQNYYMCWPVISLSLFLSSLCSLLSSLFSLLSSFSLFFPLLLSLSQRFLELDDYLFQLL